MNLFHLLPQDTRIVELTSGFALFLFGLVILLTGHGMTTGMVELKQLQYWYILTLVFGVLQVASIVLCTSMEHVRFVLAWFTGSFWVWSSAEMLQHVISPSAIGALVLGVMNLYAFVVNLLLAKQSWK